MYYKTEFSFTENIQAIHLGQNGIYIKLDFYRAYFTTGLIKFRRGSPLLRMRNNYNILQTAMHQSAS